jgi:hypothetical protein
MIKKNESRNAFLRMSFSKSILFRSLAKTLSYEKSEPTNKHMWISFWTFAITKKNCSHSKKLSYLLLNWVQWLQFDILRVVLSMQQFQDRLIQIVYRFSKTFANMFFREWHIALHFRLFVNVEWTRTFLWVRRVVPMSKCNLLYRYFELKKKTKTKN